MSLILEALKRSENERLTKSNKAGELVTSSFGDANTTRKRGWLPQFLAIALAVNAVLLGGLYLSSKNNPEEIDSVALETPNTKAFLETEKPQITSAAAVVETASSETESSKRRNVKAATPLAEELVKSTPSENVQNSKSSWDDNAVAQNAAPAIPADFAMIETEETTPATQQSSPVSLRELTNDLSLIHI